MTDRKYQGRNDTVAPSSIRFCADELRTRINYIPTSPESVNQSMDRAACL